MGNFWPSDLDLTDTQSPREILEAATADWHTNSDGVMTLVLQDATSKSGNPMIIVHAKHVPSNRTTKVLSVIHRPDNPYPVAIQLEDENLPDFLKKSYTRPSPAGVAVSVAEFIAEHQVSNRWVSETPAEFRKKLAEAFNQGVVKSRILNLISYTPDTPEAPDDDDDADVVTLEALES